jgi:large subunit ribosomal protein L7Ae
MGRPIYVRFETPKDMYDKVYQMVEVARDTGKVRKGTNEVTKLVERGEALFVVMAEDVSPEEILAHMPLLCEEREVPYAYVPSKQELGVAAGLGKSTASCCIVDPGKGKSLMEELSAKVNELRGK